MASQTLSTKALCIALCVSSALGAAAQVNILPDWDKLTNFKTSVTYDLAPFIAFWNAEMQRDYEVCMKGCGGEDRGEGDGDCMSYCGPGPRSMPYSSESGSGTIQVDVLGERFRMTSEAQGTFSEASDLPPPLRGAHASGSGSIAFDAKNGFAVYKVKGSMRSSALGEVPVELCAKVNFPQGLLPPGQQLMSQLDKVKPQVQAALNQMPHQDVIVDGSSVELYEKPGEFECKEWGDCDESNDYCSNGPPGCLEYGDEKENPDLFAGIMSDATPVGAGIQGPADGKWDSAIIKFSDWTKGAGSIKEESCDVTMSAAEFFQSSHGNRSLWILDQLMSTLKRTEPLSSALAFIPTKPSQILESAARLESLNADVASLSDDAKAPISSPSPWATMTMAAVGGVLGAACVLALTKMRRGPMRDPPLLA
jgi:hypothetical protein